MSRRQVLMCCSAAAAAGLFTSLAFVGRSALRNPCLGALPQELASHDLVHAAWEGLDPNQVWDAHVHLLGTGDSGSGCSIHPDMHRWWHPVEFTRRHVMLNAACVATDAESIDRAYVQQLLRLAHDFPAGARWCLFAFEHSVDDTGRVRADWSTFHVPNEYAARVAEESGGRFEWVASVHPYREDALERLQAALRLEAVAVKWLPSAMNIDLRDPRCRPFYDALAASGVPLIVHCGEEQAVRGAAREDLGNPLLVRAPLQGRRPRRDGACRLARQGARSRSPLVALSAGLRPVRAADGRARLEATSARRHIGRVPGQSNRGRVARH